MRGAYDMTGLFGAEGSVLDRDLFAVFGSPEALREEDRLLYEVMLADGAVRTNV